MRSVRTTLVMLFVALGLAYSSLAYAAGVPIQIRSIIGDKSTLQMKWTGNDTFQGRGRLVVHACKKGQCGMAGGILVYTGNPNSSGELVSYYQNNVRLQPGEWQLRGNWVDPSGRTLNYVDSPPFTVK